MERMEQKQTHIEKTPLRTLYETEASREPREIMGEAAEIEQQFIYAEAAHDVTENERAEMSKDAVRVIDELQEILKNGGMEKEMTEVAQNLKESLESHVRKQHEGLQ